jgi:hypothetical protein
MTRESKRRIEGSIEYASTALSVTSRKTIQFKGLSQILRLHHDAFSIFQDEMKREACRERSLRTVLKYG